jgi:hypothetical protein
LTTQPPSRPTTNPSPLDSIHLGRCGAKVNGSKTKTKKRERENKKRGQNETTRVLPAGHKASPPNSKAVLSVSHVIQKNANVLIPNAYTKLHGARLQHPTRVVMLLLLGKEVCALLAACLHSKPLDPTFLLLWPV